MSEHYIEKYDCGHVKSQCRCASTEKRVIRIAGKCPLCSAVEKSHDPR